MTGSRRPPSTPDASRKTAQGSGLHALVVTHDRKAHLARTLGALLAHPRELLAGVLVVDNASRDGTAELLAAETDPRLTVLTLPANTGGAGGFEAGFRALRAEPGLRWLAVMDDDAAPAPGAFARFLGAERGEADLWFAAVRYPEGDICEMNRPWWNPFAAPRAFLKLLLRGRAGFHIPDAAFDAPAQEIGGGSFVGLFVSARALSEAPLPEGRLFLYGDDVLFSLGARKAGFSAMFDPDLGFIHDCRPRHEGGHQVSPAPAPHAAWTDYYLMRNRLTVYRRAAGPLAFWPVLAVVGLKWWRETRASPAKRRLLGGAIRDALSGHVEPGPAAVKARFGL